MEKHCLMLGFYLASWGMLRGSSFLLQKSAKYYEPTVELIMNCDDSYWDLDVNYYSYKNIERVIQLYNDIKGVILDNDARSHLTLVSKIMLGVFGIAPAFDTYFCNSFRKLYKPQGCSFSAFNVQALSCLKEFYDRNKEEIDQLANSSFCYEFNTGEKGNLPYPKAKIIDLYGVMAGSNE